MLDLIVSGESFDDKDFMKSNLGAELGLDDSDFPEYFVPLKRETFSIWSNLEKMFLDCPEDFDDSDLELVLIWSSFVNWLPNFDWSNFKEEDLDCSDLLDWLDVFDCSDFPDRLAAKLASPLNGLAPALLDWSLLDEA